MSFVEVCKGFLENAKLVDQKSPTGNAAWESAFYLPGVLCTGIEEFRSGRIVTEEIPHSEALLILDGEGEIMERNRGETVLVGKGDIVLFKKGAKLTIIPKTPLRAFFVTVPPYQETPSELSKEED